MSCQNQQSMCPAKTHISLGNAQADPRLLGAQVILLVLPSSIVLWSCGGNIREN